MLSKKGRPASRWIGAVGFAVLLLAPSRTLTAQAPLPPISARIEADPELRSRTTEPIDVSRWMAASIQRLLIGTFLESSTGRAAIPAGIEPSSSRPGTCARAISSPHSRFGDGERPPLRGEGVRGARTRPGAARHAKAAKYVGGVRGSGPSSARSPAAARARPSARRRVPRREQVRGTNAGPPHQQCRTRRVTFRS